MASAKQMFRVTRLPLHHGPHTQKSEAPSERDLIGASQRLYIHLRRGKRRGTRQRMALRIEENNMIRRFMQSPFAFGLLMLTYVIWAIACMFKEEYALAVIPIWLHVLIVISWYLHKYQRTGIWIR